MNIKDLQSLDIKDLKNIDWRGAKDHLFSNPNKVANIVIILAAVATVFIVYRSWISASKKLKTELVVQKEKAEALEKYEITQKLYSDFLAGVPESVSENRLIEMLSEMALNSGVRIVSLSPTTRKSDSISNSTNIEITLSSKNYAGMVRFVHKLENTEHLIRIKAWRGALQGAGSRISSRAGWGGARSRRTPISGDANDESVEVTIEIETLEFINA